MKLVFEIEVEKGEGRKVDEADVAAELEAELDGYEFWPQNPNADEPTRFEISKIVWKP